MGFVCMIVERIELIWAQQQMPQILSSLNNQVDYFFSNRLVKLCTFAHATLIYA